MNAFLIFLAIYVLVILGIGLIIYIFNALGLVAIAKHRNIAMANLAWVPFWGTAYVTGAIADEQSIHETGRDPRLKVWLLAMSVALTVLSIILNVELIRTGLFSMNDVPDMGFMVILMLTVLIGLPFTVMWYAAHYRLFKSCQPMNATLFLILSIVFGLSPFLVFAVRHYVDGQRIS